MFYAKHYVPLECNPDLFTQLIHSLGASSKLEFQDVLSLDSDMLAFVPRPVLALILVFPTSDNYEKEKAFEESAREYYKGWGETEDVTWFKQTINNACGLYGILHAICNGEAKEMIGTRTHAFKYSTNYNNSARLHNGSDSVLLHTSCTSRPVKGHRGLRRD